MPDLHIFNMVVIDGKSYIHVPADVIEHFGWTPTFPVRMWVVNGTPLYKEHFIVEGHTDELNPTKPPKPN